MKQRLSLFVLLIGLFSTSLVGSGGCQLFGPDQTASTQPSGNPVVLQVEGLTQTLVSTIHTFLTVDDENRTFMRENLPEVHAIAETVRRDSPDVIRQVRTLTKAYKASRNKPDSDRLNDMVDRLQDLARMARQGSMTFDSKKQQTVRSATRPS